MQEILVTFIMTNNLPRSSQLKIVNKLSSDFPLQFEIRPLDRFGFSKLDGGLLSFFMKNQFCTDADAVAKQACNNIFPCFALPF